MVDTGGSGKAWEDALQKFKNGLGATYSLERPSVPTYPQFFLFIF
jgi:hypothetical protein